jgi:hypothetical protein
MTSDDATLIKQFHMFRDAALPFYEELIKRGYALRGKSGLPAFLDEKVYFVKETFVERPQPTVRVKQLVRYDKEGKPVS